MVENNECTTCGKITKKLTAMRSYSGDDEMCCDDCVGAFEIQADMEYERQREEGL